MHELETLGRVVAQSQAHQNNDDILVSERNIPNFLFVAAVLTILALVVTPDFSINLPFLDVKRDENLTVGSTAGTADIP
mgnify:CR=1 FL=1